MGYAAETAATLTDASAPRALAWLNMSRNLEGSCLLFLIVFKLPSADSCQFAGYFLPGLALARGDVF
jgi:hypothetical protein